MERNKNLNADQRPWALKGLLIGNGWISPLDQYPAYMQYAYNEGLVTKGSTLSAQLDELESTCNDQMSASEAKNRVDIPLCESVLSGLLDNTRTADGKCINMYDIRLSDDTCGRTWPPDLANMTTYLQRTDVTQALNLDREKATGWEECSGKVSVNFRAGHSVPAIQLLPDLIESGIKVLLFSGDRDLICNHIGTETLIHNMKWNGGVGFETSPGVWAPRRDWTFEGDAAGYYQQARNLTYVLFYNASHMVPFDWPRRTRDMVDRFINVDISYIGGEPTDSRLDGEKLPQTSVGNASSPLSSDDAKVDEEKLKDAEWKAYAKSGEAALIVVIIGVTVWGYFIWRSRRHSSSSGYRSVYMGENNMNNSSSSEGATFLGRVRKSSQRGDIDARDFDEAELDRLDSLGDLENGQARRERGNEDEQERDHYVIGEDDEDDDIGIPRRSNDAGPHVH